MYTRGQNREHGFPAVQPIAVLQGASGAAIQEALRRFVDRWTTSCRLVGVIEKTTQAARISTQLQSIADGRIFPLLQDLGSGSSGCALDAMGPIQAGEMVKHQITAGCDLVVLSKFGKLEAENGSGLLPAFVSAFKHNVPVLTTVSPKHEAAWTSFASPFFTFLPLDDLTLDEWWRSVQHHH